jgi:hypothetical protein
MVLRFANSNSYTHRYYFSDSNTPQDTVAVPVCITSAAAQLLLLLLFTSATGPFASSDSASSRLLSSTGIFTSSEAWHCAALFRVVLGASSGSPPCSLFSSCFVFKLGTRRLKAAIDVESLT